MSKTDKTKPAKYQIEEQRQRHGDHHILWSEVAWRRYKGEGEWMRGIAHRKDHFFSIDEGLDDWYDEQDDERDENGA